MKQGEERSRNSDMEISQDQRLSQRETGGTSSGRERRTGRCKCYREHDFDSYDFTGRTAAGRSKPIRTLDHINTAKPLDHTIIRDTDYTYSTRSVERAGHFDIP